MSVVLAPNPSFMDCVELVPYGKEILAKEVVEYDRLFFIDETDSILHFNPQIRVQSYCACFELNELLNIPFRRYMLNKLITKGYTICVMTHIIDKKTLLHFLKALNLPVFLMASTESYSKMWNMFISLSQGWKGRLFSSIYISPTQESISTSVLFDTSNLKLPLLIG